jgi:hypothetical protein
MRHVTAFRLTAILVLGSVGCTARRVPEPTPIGADGSRPCPGTDPTRVVPPTVTLTLLDVRARSIRSNVMPLIPPALSRRGARGSAIVSVVIDTLGRVDPHAGKVVSSTEWEWAVAVCRVLPRVRFEPVRENGVPVRARVLQEFRYYFDP